MAQISYRANLSSAIFPLSFSQAGRSVIVPGPDNNYDRRVDPEGEQKDAGIPQAIYLENVIPTANGYQSVGYKTLATISLGASDREVYRVVVIENNIFAFVIGPSSYDACYIASIDTPESWTLYPDWLSILGEPYLLAGPLQVLSWGTVRGTTYVFNSLSHVIASLVGTTLTDVSGSVSGLTLTDVQCVVASFNYLIAILEDGSIAWSSTTGPLDFTPSLVTGAGSGTPNAIRSQVVAAYACPEGFIIYTKNEAILAQYTGNARYPWKFTEISNSGGHGFEFNVSAPETSAFHIAFNSHGTITRISASGAEQLAPEISSLLRNEKCPLDTYNQTTKTFTSTPSVRSPYRIYYLLNRYILLHMTTYENLQDNLARTGTDYYLIYDIPLRRYGRLYGVPKHFWASPKKLYAMTVAGVVQELVFNIYDEDADFDSVLALGRFQYVRSRRLEIHEVSLEGDLPPLGLSIIPTDDGKTNLAAVTPTLIKDEERLKVYESRAEGMNHMLVITDRFSLSSVQMEMTVGGSR